MLNCGAAVHADSASNQAEPQFIQLLGKGYFRYGGFASPIFHLYMSPSLFLSYINADCFYICFSTSPKIFYVLP